MEALIIYMNLIELINVSKSYQQLDVIKNLSFSIQGGDLVLLTGKNGTGKSTLLKIMAGFTKVSSGSIVRKEIKTTYLPERIEIPLFIKASEYIKTIHQINKTNIDINLIERLNLNLNKGIHQLSKGNQKRIMIYLCFAERPKLILLDEPFDGLDEKSSMVLESMIKERISSGATVIISTHEPLRFEKSEKRIINFDALV